MIGNVSGLRILASKSNSDIGCSSSDINNYFTNLPVFVFNSKIYYPRITIIKSDGRVYFDSANGRNISQANTLDNHNTRLEVLKATNIKWGSMERVSSTTNIRYRYFAIWVAECLQNNAKELLCFRFALKIDNLGNYIDEPELP